MTTRFQTSSKVLHSRVRTMVRGGPVDPDRPPDWGGSMKNWQKLLCATVSAVALLFSTAAGAQAVTEKPSGVTAAAAPAAGCTIAQERYYKSSWIRLWACPSPRPNIDWFHAQLTNAFKELGEWVEVYYNPYNVHGPVAGSRVYATGAGQDIKTNSYYGLPRQLQACAWVVDEFACAWYPPN
ncbi:hypothetical protein M8C13_01070 [Crossiella sp. SN42]|uniref:hypothetical protein n=1 Tax=Crossiella sp. SN42 TaxID=2944808 RepID=UPI00207D3D67|nr:hypothetical protein [Crossiella sp. SN42]MCO1574349.1 hypothetical protein [Crossiella sp. SN42]